MKLDISSADRDLLERILDRALSDNRVEVRRTTTPAFHDDLAREQAQLEAMLKQLRSLRSGDA